MSSYPHLMRKSLNICEDRGAAARKKAMTETYLDTLEKEFKPEFSRLIDTEEPSSKQLVGRMQIILYGQPDPENEEIILPLELLSIAIDRHLVTGILEECDVNSQGHGPRDKLVDSIRKSYRQVLATLCIIKEVKSLREFLEQKITDDQLPITSSRPKTEKRKSDGKLQAFIGQRWVHVSGWGVRDWTKFAKQQWSFHPPFLSRATHDLDPESHHYTFNAGDWPGLLDFPADEDSDEATSVQDSQPSDGTEGEDTGDGEGNEVAKVARVVGNDHGQIYPDDYDQPRGAGGTVSKMKFHRFCHDFGSYKYRHRDGYLALKELHQKTGETSFLREAYVWKQAEKLGYGHNTLPLLCSWESGEGLQKRYYLVSPWATGSMMKLFQDSPAKMEITASWILQQCSGLSELLHVIHGNEEDKNPDTLFYRHGDIKPSNILWIHEHDRSVAGADPVGSLAFGDWGIGKAHHRATRTISDPERTQHSSTYCSPEYELLSGELDKKKRPIHKYKIGRKADIWSFGCTLIELVTWYLFGWQGFCDFAELRGENLDEGRDHIFSSDRYYFLTEGKLDAQVKPSVIDWVETLKHHPDCRRNLDKLLDYIVKRMLVVHPNGRATAKGVTKQLTTLYAHALGGDHGD